MAVKEVVDFDQLYPGRFIKAGDLAGKDVTLTIASVHVEDLEGQKKQAKGVVAFKETQKQLVLNRTNGECIKALFGRKLADWIGKRITIYAAKIESDLADIAVRVRGSPDIAADVTFQLSLARKRPKSVTLKKTGKGAPKQAAQPTPAAPSEDDFAHDLEAEDAQADDTADVLSGAQAGA